MRILISTLFFLFISIISFAQNQNHDIIYLKKGGEIHGTIIQGSSVDQVSIRTDKGKVFTFKMEEVREVSTIESVVNSQDQNDESSPEEEITTPERIVKGEYVALYLNNGKKVNCKILEGNTNEFITVKTMSGETQIYTQDEIKGVGKFGDSKMTQLEKGSTDAFFAYHRNQYVAFGLGFGFAYGAAGAQFHARFGGNIGFGVHIGAGYMPELGESDSFFLYNLGVKLYLYRAVYVDFNYGVLGDGIVGPGLKLGGDLFVSKHFGINIAGGWVFPKSYGTHTTFDIGVFVKF